MEPTRARKAPRRGLVLLALASALALGIVVSLPACTEGATPDCSGANAAACLPSQSGDAATEGGSVVLPDASRTADAGDAGARDASDAGDGG